MTSGYLGRVVARAREELEVVEPVLGSRYEEGPQAPGLEEIELFRDASARRPAPPRPVEVEPIPAAPERREEPRAPDPKPTAVPAPVRTLREEATRSIAALEAAPPRTVRELLGPPPVPVVQAAEPVAAEAAPDAEQEAGAVPPAAVEREVQERVVEVEGRERTRVELLEWERVVERMAPPTPERPASIVTRRVAEPQERPSEPGLEKQAPPATPEVHVHIGRIEIVAPPEAAPPTPARRARFEPELSLAAYLEERRKRGS